MSDVIQLLPDSVANQIAAGEVIQRPASVIKELVENAIDAKATSVQIILKDAGRTLIQIVDNGMGMSPTDARLAFERHSTSKIRNADDLFSLHTMGFRGEALASIAAISQIELKTQRAEDSIGTIINISASKCENQNPCVYGTGSSFKVKNIFFNVPARRKFLKSNQVELSNILREFERLALINEDVEFQVTHNDVSIHSLSAGSFKKRIVSLFGKSLESQIIPVNVKTSIVNIEGFVCLPEFTRKRNFLQYLFVNGRYMRHSYFHKAITSCFEKLIPPDHQPNYFLKFTVEPNTIDVNIHPTKTEIKFENEQLIWPIIAASIKEAIGKYFTAPSIDFDSDNPVEIPVLTHDTVIHDPMKIATTNYNPFKEEQQNYIGGGKATNRINSADKRNLTDDWTQLYDSFLNDPNKSDQFTSVSQINNNQRINQEFNDFPVANNFESELLSIGENHIDTGYIQIKDRYIAMQAKSGLMLIDQHRAHMLVIYENLLHQMNVVGSIQSQRILFPETIEVQPSFNEIITMRQGDIRDAGFDLSYIGNNCWSINSLPAGLDNQNIKDTVFNIIETLSEIEGDLKDEIIRSIAMEIAKKSAIPYDKKLSVEEIEKLTGDLLAMSAPNFTPDGKPIIKILTADQLNKLFN